MNIEQKICACCYLILFAAIWSVSSFPAERLTTSSSAEIPKCSESIAMCNESTNGTLPSGMRMLNEKTDEDKNPGENQSVMERREDNSDLYNGRIDGHIEDLSFELINVDHEDRINFFEDLSRESVDQDFRDPSKFYKIVNSKFIFEDDHNSKPANEDYDDHNAIYGNSIPELLAEYSKGRSKSYEDLGFKPIDDEYNHADSSSFIIGDDFKDIIESYEDLSSKLIDEDSKNRNESYEELSSEPIDEEPEFYEDLSSGLHASDNNSKLFNERKNVDQESEGRHENIGCQSGNCEQISANHEVNGGLKRDLSPDLNQFYRELSVEDNEDRKPDQEIQRRSNQNGDQDDNGKQNSEKEHGGNDDGKYDQDGQGKLEQQKAQEQNGRLEQNEANENNMDVYGFLFESNNTEANNTHRKFFNVMKDMLSGSRITFPLNLNDPYIRDHLIQGLNMLNATLQTSDEEEDDKLTLY